MKTETKETQTEGAKTQEPVSGQPSAEGVERKSWQEMTTQETHEWYDEVQKMGAWLDAAETQIKMGKDATPLLRLMLEAVRGLLRSDGCEWELTRLLTRISALASATGKAEAMPLCERALEIADEMWCDECRGTALQRIVEESIKMTPDPEVMFRLGKQLISRVEEFEGKYAERRCKRVREEAESRCKAISEKVESERKAISERAEAKCKEIREGVEATCAFVMGVARSRSSSFQEMLESIRPAKESGEFQKPDFAKKPAPQPAEEKAKRGDKI